MHEPLLSSPKGALEWDHVSFSIPNKVDILHDVWGSAPSGELTAIIGGSGAGKTTLLNILANRLQSTNSFIFLNRQRILPQHKTYVSFVEQEDALWSTSTVEESLYFSARLRLPRSFSNSECFQLVKEMISQMGLNKTCHSVIGNALEESRGLSGGERKRVSIAIELISNPTQCLFLDEPTSGLDSFLARDVILMLKRLAISSQCSVLLSIHQPSSEIFSLFDQCLVLHEGRTVFCDKATRLVAFFQGLGLEVPVHYNPSDFAIANVSLVARETYQQLPSWREEERGEVEARQEISTPSESVSNWTRLMLLCHREGQSVLRNSTTIRARIGMVVGLNVVLGIVLFQAGEVSTNVLDIQTHFAVLTLLCTGAMIAMSNPIALTFPLEKPILLRELAGGFYTVPVYFWSKLVVESLLGLVQACLTIAIVKLLVGLQGNFMEFVLVIWGLGLTSASVALLISASVDSVKTAVAFNPALIVPQLLFAGFVVPIAKIPVYLKVFTYLSQLRFAIALLVLIEFRDDPNAQYILTENEIETEQIWFYVFMLVLNFVGFRLAAMAVLWKRSSHT